MKTKNLFQLVIVLFSSILLMNCHGDDDLWGNQDFVVAFKNPSENITEEDTNIEIELVFSKAAPQDGWLILDFNSDELEYGVNADFTTYPEAEQGLIQIPISKGSTQTSFVFNGLTETLFDDPKSVSFTITQIEIPNTLAYSQGNQSVIVSLAETAALGGTLSPEIGGPNEPNQIYLELRSKKMTKVRRDTWELGFYSGEEFRVKLNTSMYMFAGKLSSQNINQVSSAEIAELQSKMNFLISGSDQYVDNPNGDINETAISEIKLDDNENNVYLLKLGYEIGTETPEIGGIAIAGAERGYMKIRILRQGDDYLLQYATLDETEHHEVLIPKTPGFNFTFFSLQTQNIVEVEPEAPRWDLNFTVKTEVEEYPGEGYTAYGYSDYVETNPLGNVKAYRVYTDEYSYEAFTLAQINESKLSYDQRTIGASWRKTTPPDKHLYENIFYIIKDADGNLYKLKFTAFENENGARGYPQFKYERLN